MKIHLRAATETDHGFLYGLHCVTMRSAIEATWGWEEDWQRADFVRRMAAYDTAIIENREGSCGVLQTEKLVGTVYVHALLLLPEHQGRGIGTRILREVMSHAADEERSVTLSVLEVNPRARSLYERLGFYQTAHEPPFVRMRFDPIMRGTV